MAVGMFGYVACGVESQGGTASHSVAICDWLPLVSETLAEQRTDLPSAAITGIVDVQNICQGPGTISGNVTVEVQPVSIGYLFRSFFDSTTTAQGSGAATTFANYINSHATNRIHRFIASNAQFQAGSGSDVPTLTLHAFRGPSASTAVDSAFGYFQMACSDLEITFDTGAYITANAGFQGRGAAYVPSTTATIPQHVCFMWDSVSVSVAGAGDATFQNITWRGSNNMEFIRTLDGTVNPSLLKRNALRSFELSGNMSFQNHAQFGRFKNGSEFPMVITVRGPQISSGYNHTMRIDMPRVKFTQVAPQIQGPGFISMPFQATAFYSPGSATACDVWLVNTRISDYRTNSAG